MSKFLIYGLVDPRTLTIRYVGQSAVGLERPRYHGVPGVLKRNVYHSGNWIRELQREGLTYTVAVLETADSRSKLNELERWWIAYGRACGWDLTNHTDGGDAIAPRPQSPQSRARKSAAMRGIRPTATARARMSEAQKKVWMRPGYREAASERARRRMASPEARARISARTREQMLRPGARERISERQRKLWQDPAYKKRASRGRADRIRGDRNPAKRPEVREKLRAAARLREQRRREQRTRGDS